MQKQQMNCDYNSFTNRMFNLNTNQAMNVYQNNYSKPSNKEYNPKFMHGTNDITKQSFSFLQPNRLELSGHEIQFTAMLAFKFRGTVFKCGVGYLRPKSSRGYGAPY